jgi:hypothetical protein
MAAKFFGQFLLESGLIDAAQLLEALEIQRASNPLLGELAVARGWLSAAQAARINERQRAEDKRFGDLAEEMGLLDADRLGRLLDEQKSKRKLFGEILVERGMLTRVQLDDALSAHQADREDATRSLETGLAGHPLADLAHAAITTCSRLFPRLLKSQCQFSSLVGPTEPMPGHALAHVRIDAARPLTVAVGCDRATMTAIACGFLGIPAAECDDELARDALGELVNVLMGYIVKDVLPEDMDYRATPPDFSADAAALAHAGHPALAMAMTSQLGPLLLVVRG